MLNFHAETSKQVQDMLTQLYMSKQRIRLYYGDTTTGRSWLDEHDIYGTIGRSTGSVKVPLLIYNSRSSGGGHILDHCVIRIDTKHSTLYKHDNFHTPVLTADDKGGVYLPDGSMHAYLGCAERASRYIDWITGKRYSR